MVLCASGTRPARTEAETNADCADLDKLNAQVINGQFLTVAVVNRMRFVRVLCLPVKAYSCSAPGGTCFLTGGTSGIPLTYLIGKVLGVSLWLWW